MGPNSCVYRKLDSANLVIKAAENGTGFDCSNALNSPMDRTILVQGLMGPHAVVIGGILAKNPVQVSLSEYDEVVEAFPPDRADQSFRVPVLPWRASGDWLVANAHGAEPAPDRSAVNPILVSDHIAWGFIPRKRLGDLLRDPFRRWVSRNIDQNQLAPSQSDNHQNIELNEADGRDHEQIHCRDLRGMIAKKRAPALTGWIILLGHVLGDGALSR
jgi:hypothetical protein